MRIISGAWRGRRLQGPGRKGRGIRPTSDRAREALFNILAPELAGARVLDLFAGTGALSLEALSRGAEEAVAIDNSAQAMTLMRANAASCGSPSGFFCYRRSLAAGLDFLMALAKQHGPFSLVLLDPPYHGDLNRAILVYLGQQRQIMTGDVTLVIEESSGEASPVACDPFHLIDQRVYGETAFWFYSLSST